MIDALNAKLSRLEDTAEIGHVSREFVIDVIRTCREAIYQLEIRWGELEWNNFEISYQAKMKDEQLERCYKILSLLGISLFVLDKYCDPAINYLLENNDRQNVDNIHSLACLMDLEGEIKNPEQLKNVINDGNN